MDIFISSLISGYESLRTAAADAITTLGHRVVRAEDFAATTNSPQQACLAGVRASDAVVLILVDQYGAPQESGHSPTHEEYLEARDTKPVLVFVQSGVDREAAQQTFVDEVQAWVTGHFRAAFSDADELRREIVRALHQYELATAAAPVDEDEMTGRALEMVEARTSTSGGPMLVVAVAPGPRQQIVRPAELEDAGLAREVQREAMFGDCAVLEPGDATDVGVSGRELRVRQSRAEVTVDESGGVRVSRLARREQDRGHLAIPSLIEEDVSDAIQQALGFVAWLYDRLDPTGRLSDVVAAADITDATYMPWRTRAEQESSPNAAAVGMGRTSGPVLLTPARRHRQALRHDAERIASDLTVLLRRRHR